MLLCAMVLTAREYGVHVLQGLLFCTEWMARRTRGRFSNIARISLQSRRSQRTSGPLSVTHSSVPANPSARGPFALGKRDDGTRGRDLFFLSRTLATQQCVCSPCSGRSIEREKIFVRTASSRTHKIETNPRLRRPGLCPPGVQPGIERPNGVGQKSSCVGGSAQAMLFPTSRAVAVMLQAGESQTITPPCCRF